MRKSILIATAALAASLPAAAVAQSATDDARCFLLSNGFARGAQDPKAKTAAAQALVFYLGRLDGRMTPQAMAAMLNREGPKIDPKTAGPAMNTCIQRLGAAQKALQAAITAMAPAKKP